MSNNTTSKDAGIQAIAIVIGCIVAAIFGIMGIRATIGYVTCHQQVEQIAGGLLTPAYDPITGNCTAHL